MLTCPTTTLKVNKKELSIKTATGIKLNLS